MNKVILLGRLARDPEARQGQTMTVTKFSLAVDRRIKAEGQPSADFISCVAFGKTAEFIDKYFKKGSKMALEGRIQTGSYTNKDGQKVYTTDVVVDNVEFAESKAAAETKADKPVTDDEGFMDIPDNIPELPFD